MKTNEKGQNSSDWKDATAVLKNTENFTTFKSKQTTRKGSVHRNISNNYTV